MWVILKHFSHTYMHRESQLSDKDNALIQTRGREYCLKGIQVRYPLEQVHLMN